MVAASGSHGQQHCLQASSLDLPGGQPLFSAVIVEISLHPSAFRQLQLDVKAGEIFPVRRFIALYAGLRQPGEACLRFSLRTLQIPKLSCLRIDTAEAVTAAGKAEGAESILPVPECFSQVIDEKAPDPIGISHGTDLRQMVNCDNLRELVRPCIAKLDMALALHEEQRAQIKELFGTDVSKVAVIGSGYNDSLFNTEGRTERKPGDPVMISYAGKISRPKGVPEMLKALSMLAKDSEVPAFKLTMAGGCQDEALKDALDCLPEYITWLGQIPQPALAELLRRTDIFVLPSYFEGLPLVLIEAMASGAVPVSTDLPGVRPWINANVGRPNVIYADMPEMKSIDEPTDAGRDAFTIALSAVLKDTIRGFESGALPGALPDTSAITWDGVARRLTALAATDL